MGNGPAAMVGAWAIAEGFGARDRVTRRVQLALQGLQFGLEGETPVVRHVDQIVLDARPASLAYVGLEPPANLIKAAGQVDFHAAQVLAWSLAHIGSVLDPSSIGCSPLEIACRAQATKTHFEEDVCFACDCDTAFMIPGLAGP
jgi:hypothetical protein